jgi:hypothetical protein
MTFSINSDIHMDEVYAARRGHLAFFKGEGQGEAWTSARRLEHFECVFFGSKTPHRFLSPSVKGEATDHTRFAAHCAHCKDNQPEISNGKVGQDP